MKWKKHLKSILDILARQKHIPFKKWRWGGGSALSYRLKHRDSEDIDIFLKDVQLLTYFSPRLNDDFDTLAKDYIEQSNFVKIFAEDNFQIDFIVAPVLTESPVTLEKIFGYRIQVETPVEIVLKKLFYRTDELKVRDVVDIAAVLRNEEYKENFHRRFGIIEGRINRIKDRLDFLKQKWQSAVSSLEICDESLKGVEVVSEVEVYLMSEDKCRGPDIC